MPCNSVYDKQNNRYMAIELTFTGQIKSRKKLVDNITKLSKNSSFEVNIDDEGNFHILHRPANDAEAFAPYEGHILHSFIFGPGLVIDGQLMTDDTETYVRNKYGSGAGMGLPVKAQRQALCQMGKLSYLIITTEGPNDKQDKEHGFTAAELGQLAYNMGAINAYNLDGGNSTFLSLNDVKLNRFGKGGIRDITDLIYFITAEEPPVVTEAPTEVPVTTESEGSVQP